MFGILIRKGSCPRVAREVREGNCEGAPSLGREIHLRRQVTWWWECTRPWKETGLYPASSSRFDKAILIAILLKLQETLLMTSLGWIYFWEFHIFYLQLMICTKIKRSLYFRLKLFRWPHRYGASKSKQKQNNFYILNFWLWDSASFCESFRPRVFQKLLISNELRNLFQNLNF